MPSPRAGQQSAAGWSAGFRSALERAAALVEAPSDRPLTRAQLAELIRAIQPDRHAGARAPKD